MVYTRAHTHTQSTDEGAFHANILDEDEQDKTTSGNIPMSPQRSRKTSLSSISPPPEDEKKIVITDIEL